MIQIVVFEEPYPKGRPQVAMRGKFPTVYTPKKTKEAEQRFIAQAMKFKPETPLEGALSVIINYYKVKPKSYSKSIEHWTQKTDLDNLIKLTLDAMNKIFFQDDSQIVELKSTKQFGEPARTEIFIETFK
jgi:Holliday junction resolvase RusA-like endonuclease